MAVRERYSHAIADKYKDKKRQEADARLKLRKAHSNKQQLAKLDAGGYTAKKECKRLLKSEK
jgi:hypothetical protein